MAEAELKQAGHEVEVQTADGCPVDNTLSGVAKVWRKKIKVRA